MVVCRFFEAGNCKFGDKCRNEHIRSGGGYRSDSLRDPRPQMSRNAFSSGYAAQNSAQRSPDLRGQDDLRFKIDPEATRRDLTESNGGERPEWPLSCYSGGGQTRDTPKNLLYGVIEKSPEEMRCAYYLARLQGNEHGAQQEEAEGVRLAREQQQAIVRDINGAINFVHQGKQERGNRWDIVDESNRNAPRNQNTFAKGSRPFNPPTANPSVGFGQPSGPSAFGQPSSTPAFGQPSTQSAFGQPSQPSQPAFGQSTFGQPSQSGGGFGQPSALGQSQGSAFGKPSAIGGAGGFGQPSALGAGSAFGKPAALGGGSAFGQPSAMGSGSAFGQPSAMGGAGAFGKPSGLGASSGFGQPSTVGASTPAFGTPSAAGTGSAFGSPSAMGSTSAPAFGKPAFGSSSTPAAPAFGAPSAFGRPQTAAAAPSAFGTPSAFGQPSTQQTQTSAFGQPSQPQSASPFARASVSTSPAPAPTQGVFGVPSSQPQQPPTSGFSSTFGQPSTQSSPFARASSTTESAFGRPTPSAISTNGSSSQNGFGSSLPSAGPKDSDPPTSLYGGNDDLLKQKYQYVAQRGVFEDGVMPEFAPQHGWVVFGDMERAVAGIT